MQAYEKQYTKILSLNTLKGGGGHIGPSQLVNVEGKNNCTGYNGLFEKGILTKFKIVRDTPCEQKVA